MTNTTNTDSHSIRNVLLISGIVGFFLGLKYCTWQVAVEVGQFLAGLVHYSVDNSVYIYNAKVFSLMNNLGALLLWLFDSEILASKIISVLMGMISFQAISLFIYSINRNLILSLLGTYLIFMTDFYKFDLQYLIAFLDLPATYNVFGLSCSLLIVALFALKSYKWGMLFLGLIPGIHPAWGVWVYSIFFASACFSVKYVKQIITRYFPYFLIGFSVALGGLVYQLKLIQTIPPIDPAITKLYLNKFIQNWDTHRVAFYSVKNMPEIISSFISLFLSIFCLHYFKGKEALEFIFRALTIGCSTALILGISTHLPEGMVPEKLQMLMPSRFINLNLLALPLLSFGVLTHIIQRTIKVNYGMFLAMTIILSVMLSIFQYKNFVFGFILLYVFVMTQYKDYLLSLNWYQRVIKKFVSLNVWKIISNKQYVWVFVFILAFSVLFKDNKLFRSDDYFRDRTKDPFYEFISNRKGYALTTSDMAQLTLKTRRPLLYDPAAADGFNYAAESALIVEEILNKIYGVSILRLQPGCENGGQICSNVHKDLWEQRSLNEWISIRKQFGVVDVAVPLDWQLKLPIAFRSRTGIVYEIPKEIQ